MSRLSLILLIFISLQNIHAQVFPVENIINNGSDAQRINFVILSDGYTSAELPSFITDAQTISTAIYNKSPYLEYANFFNVYAIKVPSNETGVSHPGTATDVTEPQFPVSVVDNYFGSTFDYADIHRLLVPTNSAAINSVIATNFPGADQGLIIANSPNYGGSGGAFATTSLNTSATEIAIHETGHSFALLSDEYWAGIGFANETPNMTADSNPSTVKWKDWIGENGINLYPYGTSGDPANWYRPHQNCEMRYLNQQFCSVCKEAFIDVIYNLVDPIDAQTPSMSSVDYTGTTLNFSLDLVLPNPNTLKIEWLMDGVSLATDVDNIDITNAELPLALNNLVVNVTDTTLLSKSNLPASGYNFNVTWAISNLVLPLDLISFTAQDKGALVSIEWVTSEEFGVDHFELESSLDGINYNLLAIVENQLDPHSIHNYDYQDNETFTGPKYYRLKTVDRDGQYEYSPIRLVSRQQKFFYKIYPNPVQDKLHISYFQDALPHTNKIIIYNLKGQLIQSYKLNAALGQQEQSFDLSKLNPGAYIITIQRNTYTESFNFVKE